MYKNYVDIFTDASISDPKRDQSTAPANIACAGALLLSKYGSFYDQILLVDPPKEYSYIIPNYNENITGNVTNNSAEATAISVGLQLLYKIKKANPDIAYANLYSDSNLCIQSLRDWIHNWFHNVKLDHGVIMKLCKSDKHEVMNQQIYLDCVKIILDIGIPINFFHVCGHGTMTPRNIEKIRQDFVKSNNIHGEISTPFLQYLVSNNNDVDMRTRTAIIQYMQFYNIPVDGIFNSYDCNPEDNCDISSIRTTRNIPMIQPFVMVNEQKRYSMLVNNNNPNPCTIWKNGKEE